VVFTAGVLSAFLVNDTVCLMLTPLVVRLVDDAGLPALPYLLALAFGANAGSASTLAGNLTILGSVANVIVLELAGSRARIGFWRFLAVGAVVTGTTLAAGLAILLWERALGLLG
jgi:Na+/H+ antiporter NhaD/arsenite permease-like protein